MIPLQDTIPRRRSPFVTWIIIFINLLFFMVEITLPEPALERLIFYLGIVPARYTHPAWPSEGLSYWPFLTNMFLHGGWLHFIGNMWTLWIFGDNVEDRLGHVRYAIFYLVCGVAASLTHIAFNVHSTVPAIGASGAIAGVMGAYFVMFPHSRIITLIPVFFLPWLIEVPAVVFLGFWFLSQLFSGTFSILAPTAGGGIAWWAHIGGFMVGAVIGPLVKRSAKHYRRHYPDEWHPVRHLYRI